jgi:hypothetical protein
MVDEHPTPDPVVPDYGDACVTRLVPALLDGPEGPDGWPDWLPSEVGEASRVLLLVLDGLGWRQLQARSDRAPVMTSLLGGPITTVAPSTTAAALTSISTGVPPGEHGVVGYRMAVGGAEVGAHDEVLTLSAGRRPAVTPVDDTTRGPSSRAPCSATSGPWW